MNRTLRRPMFRIGGVAEGITSGLDNPQLTASRPRYNRGRVVNPGGYAGDDTVGSALEHMDDERIQKFIRGERRSYLPQFLMSTGLDLATRPKSGNIFQQVATSAKGPLEKWMETRAARGAQEDKLSAALFGDLLDIETRKELQRKKLASEERQATIKAEGDKDFDIGAPAKIDQLRKNSYQQKLDLENELGELKAITDPSEEDIARIQQIEKAELPAVQGTIDDLEGAETTLQKIQQAGQQDNFNELIDKYVDEEGMTFEDAFTAALKFFDTLLSKRESDATGGRVGYQNAGAVLPNAMPAAMQTQAPRPTDQGQDSPVQDLSFEELRARLPQEITSDIVKLLSESKQALVDFANIRTQQDVNAFNQKYDVNLVVPQEV